tara:strand:- start:2144 stop:2896 length:753 start_codon:yes stop_codon:yes gene_type:complete
MKLYDLKNKVSIVTGASQGIGKSIAIKLANYGSKIMLVSRNKNKLQDVQKLILSINSEAIIQTADVSKYDEFSSIIANTIKEWGKIDILVNNAGITRDNIIIRMQEDDWDKVINVNLKGCFNGIKTVAKQMMKNKGGRIINITSVIGLTGNSGQSNYAASKAGIIALTKSMAKELGKRNITINAVAPGYIETNMTKELSENLKEQMVSSIPLGKLGKPDDVANMVCFLASKEAEYITGQTFNVDGGMVMI